jgi:hypothetical protein
MQTKEKNLSRKPANLTKPSHFEKPKLLTFTQGQKKGVRFLKDDEHKVNANPNPGKNETFIASQNNYWRI